MGRRGHGTLVWDVDGGEVKCVFGDRTLCDFHRFAVNLKLLGKKKKEPPGVYLGEDRAGESSSCSKSPAFGQFYKDDRWMRELPSLE